MKSGFEKEMSELLYALEVPPSHAIVQVRACSNALKYLSQNSPQSRALSSLFQNLGGKLLEAEAGWICALDHLKPARALQYQHFYRTITQNTGTCARLLYHLSKGLQ